MMVLDELLIKVGVDGSQAKQIDTYINMLLLGADKIGNNANVINQKLNKVINDVSGSMQQASETSQKASNGLEKVGKQAEKTKGQFSKLKIAIAALIGGAILFGNKIASAFNSAINNAESLFKSKNALFSISQKEIKQVEHYKKIMERTSLTIDSIRTKIAINLIPTISAINERFTAWLSSNKDLVVNGIGKTIEWIGKIIQVGTNFIQFIDKIVRNTIGWKKAIIGLGLVWAVLNRAFLTSTIGKLTIAFGVLLLLVDDLMVHMKGGKSLFGEYWNPLINGTKVVIDWFNSLSETTKKIIGGSGIVSVLLIIFGGTILKLVGIFIKGFKMMGIAVRSLTLLMMSNPIIAILTAIAVVAYLIYDNWNWLCAKFKAIWSTISSYCSEAWEQIVSTVSNAISQVLQYFGLSETAANAVVAAMGEAFALMFNIITYPFKAAYAFILGLFDIWGDDTTGFIDKLGNTFGSLTGLITSPFKKAMVWIKDTFLGFVKKVWDKVAGWLSYVGVNIKVDDSELDDLLASSKENIESFKTVQATAPNPNTINNKSTVSNKVEAKTTVNVYTSDNRDGANRVGALYEKSLADANNNIQSSVRG